MKSLAGVLLCLLVATCLAFGQGVGASGDLKGTVTDPSGAAVTQATVTVTQPERGTKRTTVTDDTGGYRVPGLAPANYDVTIEHAGFATQVQKGIVVQVGQIVNLDFHMKVSTVTSTVEVSAEPPVVETDRGSQADTVTQQYIEELPIDRRDYLTYTLLMPGVSDSRVVTDNTDFRVVQTPQSGLSFYGSNGRGNHVTVDSGEVNDDGGGVRLTVTQEAVQEFQINRSNYNAELGGASGAAVNIVTKSGTNAMHGSVFAFFRKDVFDARNTFSFSPALPPGGVFNPALPDVNGAPIKDDLSREQFGGSIGFPLQKDKTFLYLAYEGLRRDEQHPAPLFTSTTIFRPNTGQQAIISGLATLPGNPPVPCLTGQPALPAATCAAILTNILTINNLPPASPLNKFLVAEFENNAGLFPFTDGQDLGNIRLDHRFSDRNQVSLSFHGGRDDQANPNLQALTGFSRAANTHAFDATGLASWFHTFSPMTLNEMHAQYNYSSADYASNDSRGVGLDLPGFGLFGSNIFLPSFTIMRRWEFGDNATLIRGHHTVKVGGAFLYRGNHTESHTFFPGRFVFGDLPGGILSPCLQVPAACGLTTSAATINSLQSASLGLPQFYQQGFDNPVYNYPRPFGSFYVQDSWAMKENFTLNFGLRYEIDGQYGALPTDTNNFAPRIAFAWDPFKDHKTVVRGGFGLFYSPIYGQIADVVQTLGMVNGFRQIAQVFVPLTGEPGNPALTSAAIFQTLFAQGLVQCGGLGNSPCITPANLTQFGIAVTHTGPVPPLTVLFSAQPGYSNPYTQQASFGVEREVAPGWSVAATYIYVHGLKYPRPIDINLLPTTPTVTVQLANGGTTTFHNWRSPACGVLVNNPCFGNLLLLQGNMYTSTANSTYHAGIFELKKRFSNHFSLGVNYTYSKAIDDSTDYNSDFEAADQANLQAERALSDFDQRHNLVIYGAFESPWHGGADASMGEKILAGFTLTPIVSYHTGHPFNLLAGTDVNGDRHSTNDRPIGAGRNTGIGPNYFSWDMRLARAIKVGEKANLDIMVESFNILNHTNFATVNNVVGPNMGLPTTAGGQGFLGFAVEGTTRVAPSSPLGFTSAFPKREVQIGVRLTF